MSDIPLERPYRPEYIDDQLQALGRWRALLRVLQILSVLLSILVCRVVDGWAWTYRRGETGEDRQRRRAEWLLDRIIWLGPAFVKVGQSLGTRPDLVPLVYVDVLATLQDRLPAFPNELAFGFIEEELGWKPETLFDEFDHEPFAAASLGQVYHAITFEGVEVAVKVQRPDLRQVISVDLALVRRLAGFLERFPRLGRRQPWVSLVDEFGSKLFEELDYVHEAHLTERFGANIAGLPGVGAPDVLWDFTSRRVITTEFVDGIKITDKDRLQAAAVDIPTMLGHGVRANLMQLFEHGLFHADPHPGNLLVRPEDGTLVFIDFGMMGIIPPDQRLRILEMFVDVINQRPENLRDNLVDLGILRSGARWDELAPMAIDLFQVMFGAGAGPRTFQEVTNSFAPLLYEYDFRIPVNFAYIARAILTLEGICLQLDPDFDIFAVSAPYAVRMMLTFPDASLRQRLMDELLTPEGELDWTRLQQLAGLAVRNDGFRLETDGLAEPALDMLLSPEGATLRHALIADMLRSPEAAGERIDWLAPLISADPTISGQAILERLVAFLLSEEGAGTRAQLAKGLRRTGDGSGGFDLERAMELASLAGRLHPEFRTSTLVRALGGYLLSAEGGPARQQLLTATAQRVVDGLASQLNNLARPVPPPTRSALAIEGECE
jgi:predicted unusual protein kinase regulating ubiquinone biosynthesis (AarF/ABC1/UbiB family)